MTRGFHDPHIKIDGDAVLIPLSKGKHKRCKYARIDHDDLDRVIRHKWYAKASGKTFYGHSTSGKNLPRHHRQLHMFIARAHPGQRVDHRNGDGLDCRKENLRAATVQQNAFNAVKTDSPHVTSKFKGVSRSPSSGKWIAQIKRDGVPHALGVFEKEEDAARAYDEAAARLFGDFAKTNDDMGLFDADKPNRNADPGAYLNTFAKPDVAVPEWQRYLETGERYVSADIDDLNREAEIRKAVSHIQDHRLRRKKASTLRRSAA